MVDTLSSNSVTMMISPKILINSVLMNTFSRYFDISTKNFSMQWNQPQFNCVTMFCLDREKWRKRIASIWWAVGSRNNVHQASSQCHLWSVYYSGIKQNCSQCEVDHQSYLSVDLDCSKQLGIMSHWRSWYGMWTSSMILLTLFDVHITKIWF